MYEHPSVTRTGSVRGMVVAVDEAFGNLITNIPQKTKARTTAYAKLLDTLNKQARQRCAPHASSFGRN